VEVHKERKDKMKTRSTRKSSGKISLVPIISLCKIFIPLICIWCPIMPKRSELLHKFKAWALSLKLELRMVKWPFLYSHASKTKNKHGDECKHSSSLHMKFFLDSSKSGRMFYFIIKFSSIIFSFPLVLINMKQNLISYDITFVD
jgi:hypothetical protein